MLSHLLAQEQLLYALCLATIGLHLYYKSRTAIFLAGITAFFSLFSLSGVLLGKFTHLNFELLNQHYPVMPPQSAMTGLLSSLAIIALSAKKRMAIRAPFLSVAGISLVGLGVLTLLGHSSGVSNAYLWTAPLAHSEIAGSLSCVVGFGILFATFKRYKRSRLGTRDLWMLIVIYSTLGVTALCLFSILFTAIPFYGLIGGVVSDEAAGHLQQQLLQFTLTSILFTLFGASGIYLLVRDLVDRAERHQRAAMRGRLVNQSLVGSAPDGILRVDRSGKILDLNPTAEKIFASSKHELIGRSISDIILAFNWEEHTNGKASTQQSPAPHNTQSKPIELTGIRNAQSFPIEVSISGMTFEGDMMYVVFVRDVSLRQESERNLKASLRESKLLLKELHHRVKNNLQIVSSLLSLQSSRSGNSKMATAFRDSQNRVQSMALVHELLYSKGSLSTTSAQSYFSELCYRLSQTFDTGGRVALEMEVDDLTLDLDLAIPCGLIVNELVTNAFQHAFPNKREGKVRVAFHLENGERYALRVADDGVGILSGQFEAFQKSLGTKLVERLSKQLGAELQYSGPPGFGVHLVFKKQLNHQAGETVGTHTAVFRRQHHERRENINC